MLTLEEMVRFEKIREHMRSGLLSLEKVKLAAYLGDLASAALVTQGAPEPCIEAWAGGLERWGPEPCVRALIAIAEAALPAWKEQFPDDITQECAISAAREWVKNQTCENADAARNACDCAFNARIKLEPTNEAVFYAAYAATQAAFAAGNALSIPRPGAYHHPAGNALVAVIGELIASSTGDHSETISECHCKKCTSNNIRNLIKEKLLSWALGDEA